MRICSFLPGATEVLAELGLGDNLVGISHECDFPQAIRNKPVMVRSAIDNNQCTSEDIDAQVRAASYEQQSLYSLNETLFLQTKPDVVILQDLCHVCAITPQSLEKALAALPNKPTLIALNPKSLEDIFQDISRIGMATSRETQARSLISSLRIKLQNIRDRLRQAVHRPKVVCLEWLNPLFVAGHWVPEMVEQAEAFDVLGAVALPSRRCSREEVIASDPDILILMPCGFSADRAAREAEQLLREQWWGRLRAVRNNQVFTVDASSFFSRPGPRLIDGIAILAAVFHPDIFGTSFGPSVSRLSLTTPA